MQICYMKTLTCFKSRERVCSDQLADGSSDVLGAQIRSLNM